MFLHTWHNVISCCKGACHNCALLQIRIENIKAVNMEGCQQCAFLCEDTNPTNWFVSSFESSWNNLLDKFAFVDIWIAFSIASLRIDEWWISSQNHNLANLFSDVQSTNSISSRGQTTTFLAWTSALVLKVWPWWSTAEMVFFLAICNCKSFTSFKIPP